MRCRRVCRWRLRLTASSISPVAQSPRPVQVSGHVAVLVPVAGSWGAVPGGLPAVEAGTAVVAGAGIVAHEGRGTTEPGTVERHNWNPDCEERTGCPPAAMIAAYGSCLRAGLARSSHTFCQATGCNCPGAGGGGGPLFVLHGLFAGPNGAIAARAMLRPTGRPDTVQVPSAAAIACPNGPLSPSANTQALGTGTSPVVTTLPERVPFGTVHDVGRLVEPRHESIVEPPVVTAVASGGGVSRAGGTGASAMFCHQEGTGFVSDSVPLMQSPLLAT